LHLAQDTGDEAPSQGSRPTQSKTDDDDDVPVPEIVPWGPIIGTGVGLGLSGQTTKEVLVTEEQGRHTEQEYPHTLTPTTTLHRHHRPIHLLDRSVASNARGCDIADTGV
ncbi:hypothetical protein JOQ06_006090, partial [Pogonophryne albipinna]